MRDDIAIVGMACVFPGAPDLAAYWRNLQSGFDAIQDVPTTRWDPVFYDPASTAIDRFYCKRGGFVDALATFDPIRFGVMPVAARGAEPDQLLTLEVASRALADAGYLDRAFPREKTGVVLGRGNYPGAGRARLEQHVRTAEQVVTCLRSLLPDLSEAELARVKHEFQAQTGAAGADAAIGLVPNLTASRVSNRLDLQGSAFTVDAACASSLVAVDHACAELASGRADMMLAGGVHLCHDEAFWSVFCQLGALSRDQQIRPFDRRADGLLIGEGIGVTVLKRARDAERDGDRVYAVIRGTGVSSDGREASMMTPRVEGQLLALERAWKAADADPTSVGLVEAHGTGTAAGDAAELLTLKRFFGAGPSNAERATLGSVKSMIGHAMPAAGMAGLIKAALAVHHGVLLPTLHCEEPRPEIDATRFRVLARQEPWERGEGPRRAAVNAFGFGGINAHVVIEEHAASKPSARAARVSETAPTEPEQQIALFSADSRAALLACLDEKREARTAIGERVAIVNPTAERIARARAIVEKGRPWRGREGIWFSPKGLLSEGGRLAFVFPGVDASFEPRVDDVAERFGLPLPACTSASNLEEVGIGIIGVNRLLARVLQELGIVPQVMAGHSIGEWSGMIASGVIPDAALDAFIAALVPGTLKVPGVVFAAAGCSVERATAAMESLEDIGISHDNCPHQVIFCGKEAAVDVALARLQEDGVLCQKLPFQSGFHSPLFADYVAPHRQHFADLPLEAPKAELWSATTCAPYPADLKQIRALAVDHLVKPVRFRELVESLYAEGVRVFVQVGTGSLVHFIEDTLRGRPHAAISANVKERSGLSQLTRLAATLFVEGADLDWTKLAPQKAQPERAPMTLSLGVPLVRFKEPLALRAASPAAPVLTSDPVASAFASSMAEIERAQSEVMAKLAHRTTKTGHPPREVTLTRTLSIAAFPELMDHSFFRQPPGWPNVSDRHPVVPMTMSIELMMEAALALSPGRVAVAIENVRAFRWLAVSTPVDAKIVCLSDGADRVQVSIENYCEGTVVFADGYAAPPPDDTSPLTKETPSPLSARRLYDERWMFHGPAYQGIALVSALGDDGIRGELEAGSARGSLLDNAGQLFGFWVMVKNDSNRMAMPVQIERLTFFGPPPSAGERLGCTVRIRRHEERSVVADLTLARGGRTWAKIEGWEDRRFDTDARLWSVMLYPEKNLLGDAREDGLVLFTDIYRSAPTRDQLARRFLGEAERATYEKHPPRGQRAWLNGRIAAKDAVRDFLWKHGNGPVFPVEIEITNDETGRPHVRCGERDLRVSIAHKGDLAFALVAEGRDVGVDVEQIEPRSEAFASLSFSDEELRLIGEDDRDEWLTRMWAAKEAVGKARGTGLKNNPRHITVRDRAGERLLVDGWSIETRRHGDFILSWTDLR